MPRQVIGGMRMMPEGATSDRDYYQTRLAARTCRIRTNRSQNDPRR